MQAHIDKINEMATVMKKAIEVDEGRTCEDEERIKQLEVEHILHICITLRIASVQLYFLPAARSCLLRKQNGKRGTHNRVFRLALLYMMSSLTSDQFVCVQSGRDANRRTKLIRGQTEPFFFLQIKIQYRGLKNIINSNGLSRCVLFVARDLLDVLEQQPGVRGLRTLIVIVCFSVCSWRTEV